MSKLRMMDLSKLIRGLAVVSVAVCMGQQTAAQNLFAPAARVNDTVVTEYEVQQRQRFLQLLNAPGSDRVSVLDALIDDRLRHEAVESFDLQLSADARAAGMSEFASRANLSTEEFVKALEQAGVSAETFRDFVTVSLEWRDLVRARYGNRVNITQAEIDRELGASKAGSGVRVLLSEIIIPAPPQNAARVNALAGQISQSQSTAEFASYARRYSATASRGRGGKLPWTPLEQLPPTLQPLILGLAIGEVTQPLPITNAVALFQLRAIEETGLPKKEYAEVEYAAYYIPGGRSEAALTQAAKVRAQVDVCNDLYGVAKGQPEDVLERATKKPGDIPSDIGIELSKLDPGESSVALTRSNGQSLMFLMLCKRTAAENAEVTSEAALAAIRQRKLQGYADQFLQQLRADARISRK